MQQRLGPTFHRTFSLIRPGISHILRTAAEKGRCTKQLLLTESPLGPIQIDAMLRYAHATRLTDEENKLSALGRIVWNHDPNLDNQQTLWILHYHLCSPNTLAPAYWPLVATTLFRPETEISNGDVSRSIADLYASDTEIKLNDDSISKCATALLGCYGNDRSMGGLGVLTQTSQGVYMVMEPHFPHTYTFAYLLALFWESSLHKTVSAHLSIITEALAPIFLASSSVVKQTLADLQALHCLRVQQRTFPYQVEKLWISADDLLPKVYE